MVGVAPPSTMYIVWHGRAPSTSGVVPVSRVHTSDALTIHGVTGSERSERVERTDVSSTLNTNAYCPLTSFALLITRVSPVERMITQERGSERSERTPDQVTPMGVLRTVLI